MNTLLVQQALNRNGVIMERARRRGESLSKMERNIIIAGRNQASKNRMVRNMMHAFEMEGERDLNMVLPPLKVVAVFSYYLDPCEPEVEGTVYLIRESNHPGLPLHGHVGPEALIEAGQKIPKTPTLEAWRKSGRRTVRQ